MKFRSYRILDAKNTPWIKNSLTVLYLPFNVEIADCNADAEPSFILKAPDECISFMPGDMGDIGKADLTWLDVDGGVVEISAFNAKGRLKDETIGVEDSPSAWLSAAQKAVSSVSYYHRIRDPRYAGEAAR